MPPCQALWLPALAPAIFRLTLSAKLVLALSRLVSSRLVPCLLCARGSFEKALCRLQTLVHSAKQPTSNDKFYVSFHLFSSRPLH